MCKYLSIIEVSLITFYNVLYLRLGVSVQDLGYFLGKQFRSWGIGTKALPEWYKHLIYDLCNAHKHLKVIFEVSLILFYSLTNLCERVAVEWVYKLVLVVSSVRRKRAYILYGQVLKMVISGT